MKILSYILLLAGVALLGYGIWWQTGVSEANSDLQTHQTAYDNAIKTVKDAGGENDPMFDEHMKEVDKCSRYVGYAKDRADDATSQRNMWGGIGLAGLVIGGVLLRTSKKK